MGGRGVRPEALRRSCGLDLSEGGIGGWLQAGLDSVTDLKQALGNLISFRSLWLLCRAHDNPSKDSGQPCLGLGTALRSC